MDTNVLLRFLLGDDAAQAEAAKSFFSARSQADKAFVSVVTLVEAVWVLASPRYGVESRRLLDVVADLGNQPQLAIQEWPAVSRAIDLARATGCGLPDALVAELGAARGCESTVTFDKRAAASIPAMRLLEHRS
ncbi:MAG: type II toxin-antitoxin system VapC family toxin [Propionibacteriaceae bacterium]|nr:type II toxin-antitoxin system VapC family toxin [Propionibacteriaceae bacterium]